MRRRNRVVRSASRKYRQGEVNDNIKNQIIDLFNLSPLSVTEISESYGLSRTTIYRWIWKLENGNT